MHPVQIYELTFYRFSSLSTRSLHISNFMMDISLMMTSFRDELSIVYRF